MWRDFRNAARGLRHAPAFTAAASVALALAIGVNGAIFGLVDALWLRPAGVRAPETLVRILATTPEERESGWSWPEFEDSRNRTASFDQLAVRGRRGATMTAPDGSQELLLVNVVSTNFFEMLGVKPELGRLFTTSDAAPDAEPSVVLGYSYWRTRFGSDPAVVGRAIQLGRGTPRNTTVIGVLPRTFRDLEASADRDLWLSPNTWTWIGGDPGEFQARDFRWFEMVGRRKTAVPVETATAEMATLAASFKSAFPSSSAGRGARVISDFDYRMERGSVSAKAMLALVLLVVLIACVNVANLLLARAGARTHELAVRLSLGAPRWRIMRELASESVLLGVLGASGGLLVADGLIQLLPALLPPPPGMRAMTVFQTDIRVAMFTAAVAAMTVVLFGVAPAWLAGRTDVVSAFKGTRGESARDSALKRSLVVTQVAISIVLLCVAAALARSFVATSRADIGFARKPLLTLWTVFSSQDGPTIEEAVQRLRAIPAVTKVALAVRAPLSLSGGWMAQRVTIPDVPVDTSLGPPNVKFNAVSSNYFDVFGTRIIRGRPFSPEEERGGERTVVVNEQFARQFFQGREPLDQVLDIAGSPHRIVGIAQDGVVNEIGEARQPYMYLPFRRADYGETTFVLETAGDPAAAAAAARAALRRLHPSLEPRRAITMRQYVSYALSLHRATAALTSILALAGLLLTAVGVYGVTAYRTTRRTREIGIRIALGAMRGQVLRLVLRDGLRIGLTGIAIGLPLALAGARLISALLVDVEPWDAPSFAIAVVILLFAIAIATWVPARRAAKVEPSSALRHPAN